MSYINVSLHIKIGLFTFPFVRTNMVKSACFWLFVNEIRVLAVRKHLAHAQHGLFVSTPSRHPSEVRILLWLRCLQEVLKATKNLAKISHKSIMNAKTFPTTEQLPDKTGTFLQNKGVLEEITQRSKKRETICYHSPDLACFCFSKITVCNVWVSSCCFYP